MLDDLLHKCRAVQRWGFRLLTAARACSSSVMQNRETVLLLGNECLQQVVNDLREEGCERGERGAE